jgi:nucleoside-diphosphate-sugar epimerase
MRMDGRRPRPTVLITGSSGFLGQAIAKGLKGRYQVIGLDVAKPKSTKPEIETIEIDLTSQPAAGEGK